MSPAAIRKAIEAGLNARGAWSNVTVFRYPAGDLAESSNGFALSDIANVESVDTGMAGETHQVTYQLNGGLWVEDVGSDDDDYETVESAAIALIDDLQAWIVSIRHRPADITSGEELGLIELESWDLTLTVQPAALVDFVLRVTEYV